MTHTNLPNRFFYKIPLSCAIALIVSSVNAQAKDDREAIEEVSVVAATPLQGLTADLSRLPYAVQRVIGQELEESAALSITDFANNQMSSFSINSAQNNPLQPDLQYRAFTVSPLLGLPQGLSVYSNGARLNEPLGDAVNWDLIATSAIAEMTVHGGANPVFGQNSLGGSLAIVTKNGFNYQGNSLSALAGSWDRKRASFESGGNNGEWGYYVNIDGFEEDGWRDLSESEATRWLGSVSWRNDDVSAANLTYQGGDSDLTGNGASPEGLLAIDREAVFTAPDTTANEMNMVTLDGYHFFNDNTQIAAVAYYRDIETKSFNGDASEFEECTFASGQEILLEEADELEDLFEDELGIDLDGICEGGNPNINDFDDLEEFIEDAAIAAGFDPEDFELENASEDLPPGAELSDEAINNISTRQQESYGFDVQWTGTGELSGMENSLVVGLGYFSGDADFESATELADLDPITRSTEGLGTGVFLEDQEVDVNATVETSSLYLANTLQINEQLALTLAGRFNRTEVVLRDQSGERPELNGDHRFSRFNPSVGINYAAGDGQFWYASYSESSRAPTPIELACNEGVFEVARQFAEARGDDPDDIDFECRLPNAFLADPPLKQVVAKSLEVGVRGGEDGLRYSAGAFFTQNTDDILFQSTGRATGLFANVDKTQRQGIEFSLSGQIQRAQWAVNYSWVDATFASDMMVLSPNHDFADEEGEIAVRDGDRIPGIADHQIKLWGQYRFTDAFNTSLEVVYNSSQVMRGDESNQLDEVDGYTVVNFNAQYTINNQIRLFARVDNVFDTEYENFGLIGEDPTEVIEDLDNDSARFYGAGTPRAAWLGVQVHF
ncbi:TonB-dependent receptor [Halioxenophilus aromaticivorans]|uniref:TonB-dependent receptor n=1 Tax=Halioxenophilus aromaticivorans TaxID=1306992 RepID=A0AAV3U788_9ALTE